jgi:hypothetical protein
MHVPELNVAAQHYKLTTCSQLKCMNCSFLTLPLKISIAMIPSNVRAGIIVRQVLWPNGLEQTGALPYGNQPHIQKWLRSLTPDLSIQTKQLAGRWPYSTIQTARRKAFCSAACFASFLCNHPCCSTVQLTVAINTKTCQVFAHPICSARIVAGPTGGCEHCQSC